MNDDSIFQTYSPTLVIGLFSNFLKHYNTVNLINYSYDTYADSMIFGENLHSLTLE